MTTYSKQYGECITEEEGKTAEEVLVANVGKIDPKRHLVSSHTAEKMRDYDPPFNSGSWYRGAYVTKYRPAPWGHACYHCLLTRIQMAPFGQLHHG